MNRYFGHTITIPPFVSASNIYFTVFILVKGALSCINVGRRTGNWHSEGATYCSQIFLYTAAITVISNCISTHLTYRVTIAEFNFNFTRISETITEVYVFWHTACLQQSRLILIRLDNVLVCKGLLTLHFFFLESWLWYNTSETLLDIRDKTLSEEICSCQISSVNLRATPIAVLEYLLLRVFQLFHVVSSLCFIYLKEDSEI